MPNPLPEDSPFRAAVLPETQVLLAGQDLLTGLSSRAGLESHFRLAAARARRSGARFAVGVATLAVDPATPPDEVFGHDLAVVDAARRLRASLRETDLIARLGETRFGFVAEEVTPAGIEVLHERVLRVLREGASAAAAPQVGLAVWEEGEATLAGLLRAAEEALTAGQRLMDPMPSAANAESFGFTGEPVDPPQPILRRVARRALGWLSLAVLIVLALSGAPADWRGRWLPIERIAAQGWAGLQGEPPSLPAAARQP